MSSVCSYISRPVKLENKSILISPVRIIELSQVLLIKDKSASFFSIYSIFLASRARLVDNSNQIRWIFIFAFSIHRCSKESLSLIMSFLVLYVTHSLIYTPTTLPLLICVSIGDIVTGQINIFRKCLLFYNYFSDEVIMSNLFRWPWIGTYQMSISLTVC